MNRVLIGCVWLVWSSCIFVGLLIALEDTLYVQPPKPSMHSSQKELDVAIDRRTGEVLLSKLNRPLRGYEKFEVFMSLGRSPRRADPASWLLVAFALASQVLIIHHVKRPWLRWLLFGALLVAGTLWTWYQATFWLGSMSTFMHKLLGGPIGLLGLPSLFFIYLASQQQGAYPPGKLVIIALIQGALMLPWEFVWGLIELNLGWVWI